MEFARWKADCSINAKLNPIIFPCSAQLGEGVKDSLGIDWHHSTFNRQTSREWGSSNTINPTLSTLRSLPSLRREFVGGGGGGSHGCRKRHQSLLTLRSIGHSEVVLLSSRHNCSTVCSHRFHCYGTGLGTGSFLSILACGKSIRPASPKYDV